MVSETLQKYEYNKLSQSGILFTFNFINKQICRVKRNVYLQNLNFPETSFRV